MKNVVIVDYGMGNVDSVKRAIEECGGNPLVTRRPLDFEKASYIILPGVGAFPDAMRNIIKFNLTDILSKQVVEKAVPFLGLCLGMQILAEKGFEGKETAGFGWIKGEVRKLESKKSDVHIPHVGWNEVIFKENSPLLKNIISGKDFYFVHSYHFICQNKRNIIACTPYCGNFVSIIGRDNIFGVQFHPEKSQKAGFQLIKNFLSL